MTKMTHLRGLKAFCVFRLFFQPAAAQAVGDVRSGVELGISSRGAKGQAHCANWPIGSAKLCLAEVIVRSLQAGP